MAIHLTSITSTFFINLLNRLGVKPPPPEGFDLINTVQPVSLVDSDIALPVISSTMLLDLPFTTGPQVAPAATTVLSDTGPQPSGGYQLFALVGMDNAAATTAVLELVRRNGTNTADIWAQIIQVGSGGGQTLPFQFQARVNLNQNERMLVRVRVNVVAGETVQSSLWIAPG